MPVSNITNMYEQLQIYKNNALETMEIPEIRGVQSVFNKYSIFVSAHMISEGTDIDMNKLYDQLTTSNEVKTYADWAELSRSATNGLFQDISNDNRDMFESQYLDKLTPTAENIIRYSQDSDASNYLFGPMPYSWADFLYCKYYGKIPNNHMVTLRRYPLPVYDNAQSTQNKPTPPIAQAVTWMGEDTGNKLSDIMKFSFGLVWKELEATVQDVEGNEVGFGAGIEGLGLGSGAIERLGVLLAMSRGDRSRWSGELERQQQLMRGAFGSEGPYWNQILGPVNVIHKSHIRDRGMKFEHNITLNFEYSLRSFGQINPKIAMLDLISNFLILTYNNAKFWGGAMRYFPNASHQVLFFGDQSSFYKGDWDNYFDSVSENLMGLFENAAKGIEDIMSGASSWQETSKGLKNVLSDHIFGKLARKSRPHFLSIRSLLIGNPIGEWHLTIGNPLNPIATIGNLIIENTEMQLGDILGADDFPSEIKFTVTLKHGRPRDKGDIESMFNLGNGRMTYTPLIKFPSESGTQGNVGDSQLTLIGADQKDLNNSPELTLKGQQLGQMAKLVKDRISKEWGPAFANDENLGWIIGRTELRF